MFAARVNVAGERVQEPTVLGPAMESYRGSKAMLALTGLLIPLFLFAALSGIVGGWLVYAAWGLAALMILFFWTVATTRVDLHPEGVSVNTPFGSKSMRFDEVEKVFYTAVTHTVYAVIPAGTTYSLTLVNAAGKKLPVGGSVAGAKELVQKVMDSTSPPLLKKAVERFNGGDELDFGPIHLSRSGGLKLKKPRSYKEIPWDQLANFTIHQGSFYFWRVDEKRPLEQEVRTVPNPFVLLALLQQVAGPR